MERQVRLVRIVATLLLLSGTVFSADLSQVTDDLAGEDDRARSAAIQEARTLGAPAVAALCELLSSRDTATGAAAEKALLAVAMFAARPGAESERVAAARALAEQTAADRPERVRVLAVDLLALIGGDETVPALRGLLSDQKVRERARVALERIPGETAAHALADAIEKADPPFRAALIASLGARKEKSAVRAILPYAEDADRAVRNAAWAALGQIGDPAAEAALLKAIDSLSTGDRAVAIDAYIRLADTLAAQSPSSARPPAHAMYARLLTAAQSEQHLCAALVGLGRVGSVQSVGRIVEALGSPHGRVRGSALEALRGLRGPGIARVIAAELSSAPPDVQVALLPVLGDAGETAAVSLILPLARDPNVDVRYAALDALGRIADPQAGPTLLDAARGAQDRAEKAVALGASLRVAEALVGRAKSDEARKMFVEILHLAPLLETRRAALDGLARVAVAELLPVVEPLLEDPDVSPNALGAYAAIAAATEKSGDHKKARAMYERILDMRPPLPILTDVIRRLEAMGVSLNAASLAGFVSQWWVIGPFPSPGQSLWDKSLFPESEIALDKTYAHEGVPLRWKKATASAGQTAIVHMMPLFDPHEDVVAYAHAEIVMPSDEDVRFKFGSDDGVIAWVNGQQVHVNKIDRALVVDQDIADGRLIKGKNRILVKSLQNKGGWDFCLRITDRADRPILVRRE